MTDLIDDEVAHILWQAHADMKVVRVLVTTHIRRTEDTSERDRVEAAQQHRDYRASAGSDTAGWLDPNVPAATPAGVFAHLAFHCGFASEDGTELCLREFAKLRGADWARQMLASLDWSA